LQFIIVIKYEVIGEIYSMHGETLNRHKVFLAIVQGNNSSLYLNGDRRVKPGW